MLRPSTQDLSVLPNIAELKKLCQSLAMLDAIIYPKWQGRYYSFNDCWDKNTSLASMRNAEGDDYFILFVSAGAVIKGFAHESTMSPYLRNPPSVWPGIYENVPKELKTALSDPAFSAEDVTFCIWRTREDNGWIRGDITFPSSKYSDGSADLLALLDGNPQSYQAWAGEYYEREIALSAVEHVYAHRPLTQDILTLLNAEITEEEFAEDIKEIGYAS
jgi:hypothetical protein